MPYFPRYFLSANNTHTHTNVNTNTYEEKLRYFPPGSGGKYKMENYKKVTKIYGISAFKFNAKFLCEFLSYVNATRLLGICIGKFQKKKYVSKKVVTHYNYNVIIILKS